MDTIMPIGVHMNNFEIVLKMLNEGKNYFECMELLREEAATVARDDGYSFMIYPEPLGNPSFHVRFKDEWEVVLEIFTFKILESKFGKFKKGSKLPNRITKDIIHILNKRKQIGALTWSFLLQTWNENNPQYELNVHTPIPE
jgi:hypothetical protein